MFIPELNLRIDAFLTIKKRRKDFLRRLGYLIYDQEGFKSLL